MQARLLVGALSDEQNAQQERGSDEGIEESLKPGDAGKLHRSARDSARLHSPILLAGTKDAGSSAGEPFDFADNPFQFVDERCPTRSDEGIHHRPVVP